MSRYLYIIVVLLSLLHQTTHAFSSSVQKRLNSLYRHLPGRSVATSTRRSTNNNDDTTNISDGDVNEFANAIPHQRILSRRRFMTNSVAFALLGSMALASNAQDPLNILTNSTDPATRKVASTQAFEPIDIQKVAQENKINITLKMEDQHARVYIDRMSYNRVKQRMFPPWIPRFFLPKPQPLGRVTDAQLLMASAVAGSCTEAVRSSILYPLMTIKTRIQAASSSPPPSFNSSSIGESESESECSTTDSETDNRKEHDYDYKNGVQESFQCFQEMLQKSCRSVQEQIQKGDFYAGFFPALLVNVPAAGVYFAVSDVMKKEIRQLSEASAYPFIHVDDFSIILLSILVADVVSLAVRTPAVSFSVRRQAQSQNQNQHKIMDDVEPDGLSHDTIEGSISNNDAQGHPDPISFQNRSNVEEVTEVVATQSKDDDWWTDLWTDCWRQLPTIIITDLPYLFLKISLVRLLAEGNENIAQFGLLNIFAACVASAVTTPFDVARTVILVDSDNDASNGVDGGSMEGVFEAMKRIALEYNEHSDSVDLTLEGDTDTPIIKPAGIQNLYAGWFERVIYFGLGVAWLDPLRILSFYALRDVLLLANFKL